MTVKRIMAIPLFVVGGLGLLAGFVLLLGTGLYYNWQALQALLDGNFVAGLIGIPFITMAALAIGSLLMVPFNGLLALGDWLWNSGEKASPGA